MQRRAQTSPGRDTRTIIRRPCCTCSRRITSSVNGEARVNITSRRVRASLEASSKSRFRPTKTRDDSNVCIPVRTRSRARFARPSAWNPREPADGCPRRTATVRHETRMAPCEVLLASWRRLYKAQLDTLRARCSAVCFGPYSRTPRPPSFAPSLLTRLSQGWMSTDIHTGP